MSDRIFYINARKLVSLQQVEIFAPDEARAAEIYLDMATHNELQVDEYEWWTLSKDDLDIEDHGAAATENPDLLEGDK